MALTVGESCTGLNLLGDGGNALLCGAIPTIMVLLGNTIISAVISAE